MAKKLTEEQKKNSLVLWAKQVLAWYNKYYGGVQPNTKPPIVPPPPPQPILP